MKETLRNRFINLISSEDINNQKTNFNSILLILNSIHYNRHLTKDEFNSERLRDSNLLLQKIMLNGYSMLQLISGIKIPNIEYKNFVIFNDPITLNIILRSLLETYLTFHYCNYSSSEIENEIRYKIWSYYGLFNRSKIKINTISLKEKAEEVKRNDVLEMQKLLSEIKLSDLYLGLNDAKKNSFLNDIQRNWKIKFNLDKYVSLSYQDLLNNVGLRIQFYDNQYNFLSWATHTTSILIYQLRQMYDNRWDVLELFNCLIKATSIIALATVDLILNDKDYMPSYMLLNQEQKDLLNIYSYYFRGNNYTIEKVDEN
jgi:hypothetical protein